MNFTKFFDKTPRQIYSKIESKLSKKTPLDSFNNSYPCIFVLSTGRAGTQTLSALLRLASNVFAYHEPHPKLYGLSKLAYQYLDEGIINEIFQESFLTSRRNLLDYSLSLHRGYIETSPQTTFLAPIISQLIPNAKFIHLVRNPKMVIRSGMRRQWYYNHPNDKNRIVPKHDSMTFKEWENYNLFQKNAWLWSETNQWIINYLNCIPNEHKFLLHSENLFNDKEDTIETLFNFIGASKPPQEKINQILSKRLNNQEKGNFPQPSEWSQSRFHELKQITGETAKSIGYFFD